MDYIENPVKAGESFSKIRNNINNNDAYFKASLDAVAIQMGSNIVFGTYVGNASSEYQDINIGMNARPVAVEVYRMDGTQSLSPSGNQCVYGGLAIDGHPCKYAVSGTDTATAIEIIDNGFRVYSGTSSGARKNIFTNDTNTTYYYKAYMNGKIVN